MRLTLFIFVVLFSNLSIASSNIQGSVASHIKVSKQRVRLLPPSMPNTGAFMDISNTDVVSHKVVRAKSPASKLVELHTHKKVDGVMKMRPVENIEISAQGTTSLQPGGLHVMLIGLVKPLKEGQSVPISLFFEDESHLALQVPVKKIDAKMLQNKMHH